ncbi:MAG: GLUG motif-containing protein [Planctomycetota bacterium]|jgi:hypothetical protein
MATARILRIWGTILLITTIFSLSLPAYAKYSGGTGEPNDPYQIATAEDLIALGEDPNDYDKHFILTADIDLDPNLPARKVFDKAVIAPDTNEIEDRFQGTPFTGAFDGSGHTISYLTISGRSYLGLFGQLCFGAEISDLSLEAVDVNGIGYYIGGLTGRNEEGSITSSYSTGSVSGHHHVGGLIGSNYHGSIATSYSTSTVIGNKNVGGLAGVNLYGSIIKSYSTGIISGNDFVGGLIGDNYWGSLAASYSTGTVNGNNRVGGLIGRIDSWNRRGTILTDCYSTSSVSGNTYVGGLVGINFGNLASSYSTGTVSGTAWDVGGLVGYNSGGITNCWSTSAVGGVDGVGGLLGYNSACIINCYSAGPVTGDDSVGGLVGTNGHCLIKCSSSGLVKGNNYVGGLVGINYNVIDDCYSISIVSGEDLVGGLVGQNGEVLVYNRVHEIHPLYGCIRNCYAASVVSGKSSVGGLVGLNVYGGSTECFWDSEISGQVYSDDGTGKTTAEMQTAATFLEAGWDFVDETVNGTDDIWWILEGQDYPRLIWELSEDVRPFLLPYSPDPRDGAVDISKSPILRWTAGVSGLLHDVYFGDSEDEVTNATTETPIIYQGRQPALVTFYDPGVLEFSKTYYWRIDEANEADPNSPWKGSVWSFTVIDAVTSPFPPDGALNIDHEPTLSWVPGSPGLEYDVYFGDDHDMVASATPESPDIYCGRQPPEMTTYQPGRLDWPRTYYWRIDGIDETDPDSPWKGSVWSFTTANFIVVDDFEDYNQYPSHEIWNTWIDGFVDPNYPGNGTGSIVGNLAPPLAELVIVHGGLQSMPMDYNNVSEPYYSETERTWGTPQDWTVGEADTLTLYFRGEADNSPEPLYVAVEDSAGQIVVVAHPDVDAVLTTEWQKWHIAFSDLQAVGVDVASVKKMYIGVGNRDNPQPGGTGKIYIDDIRATKQVL